MFFTLSIRNLNPPSPRRTNGQKIPEYIVLRTQPENHHVLTYSNNYIPSDLNQINLTQLSTRIWNNEMFVWGGVVVVEHNKNLVNTVMC